MIEIPGMIERVMSAIVVNSAEPVVAAREAIAAVEAALSDAGYAIVQRKWLTQGQQDTLARDAAAHRCSTTNPEFTSPVGGTMFMEPSEWERFLSAMNSPAGPTPAMIEAIKLWKRLTAPPNVGGTPGSASNTDAAQE